MRELREGEWALLQQILEITKKFNNAENFPNGHKVKKLSGAIAVEVLRFVLSNLDIVVSNRDVYVANIPNELDLLILRPGSNPVCNLIYLPADVMAVLEVKYLGSFGYEALEKIKKDFETIHTKYPTIQCIYVTIWERETYSEAITDSNLGYRCFTIFTGPGDLEPSIKKGKARATGQWKELIIYIKSL